MEHTLSLCVLFNSILPIPQNENGFCSQLSWWSFSIFAKYKKIQKMSRII